ncbi:MAG: hypothetical protein CMN80_03425 [Spongiibacter sp.]|uniref:copper chaperone PCu(A)C n=3 Tax=Spongiibacter TaxID=630749 RepID=UPI000C0B2B51|nr:copper chaperone PCu(A)C [Spongiibacter sp.]MAK43190.1 hypothetical protein [Spongiibacter sp.]
MTRKWLLLLTAILPFSAAAVELRDPVVRGLPPGQKNTAAFFSVTNPSSQTVTLRAGTSDVAGRVEIHSNSQRNGMMAMRKEDSVAIAPGQTLDFVPGGYHLMLINLKQPLRHGERVHFSLLIDGDVVQVEAPVRSVLNEPASGRHHHHGGAH